MVVVMPGLDIVVEIATLDDVASVFATAALNATADACRVPQPAASTATAARITTSSRSRIAISPFRVPVDQGSSRVPAAAMPDGESLPDCSGCLPTTATWRIVSSVACPTRAAPARNRAEPGLDDREALDLDQGCGVPQPGHADR